jgi:hypothetical protein
MVPVVLCVSVFNRQPLYDPGNVYQIPVPDTRRSTAAPDGVWDDARAGEDLGNGVYTTVSRLSDQCQGPVVLMSIRPDALLATDTESVVEG